MKGPPKPVIALGVLAVAGGAYALFGPKAGPDRWLGYVEGEPLLIAAPVPGTLASRPATRGQEVERGAPRSRERTAEQKGIEREARLAISTELGHEREQVTAVYLGR